ncbi:MAG: transferrin-binding protein-like solute binding protein [Parasphingorhabdus sp.]
MKRLLLGSAAIGAMLAFSACGGGTVASTPAPPVSTPGPTPAPTYTRIDDLAGNQTFQTATLTFTVSEDLKLANHTTNNFGSGSVITYNATNDSYTFTSTGGTSQTFFPSDSDQVNSDSSTMHWDKSVNGSSHNATLTRPVSTTGIELSYTRLGTWKQIDTNSRVQQVEYFITGVPTVTSDVPTTGTANYNARIYGYVMVGDTASSLSFLDSSMDFDVDFASGGISTVLTFIGARAFSPNSGTNFGTANGTGMITAGGRGFSGTFNGGIATGGTFSGAFFGPQAAEFGLAYFVTGDDFLSQGLAAGIKTELLP